MGGAAPNDIDVRVPVRAPVLFRERDGAVRHAGFVQRRGPLVTVRGVRPREMRRFPDGAPKVLAPYRIHDGRAWLPVPESGRLFHAWENLNEAGAAPVGKVLSALSGQPEGVALAVFGRSPLSVRWSDGHPGWLPKGGSGDLCIDETLVPRALAWAEDRFRAGVVHDGQAVYVATGLPVFQAAGRHARQVAPQLLTPPEVKPGREVAVRLDLREPFLAIARRHCPITRVETMSALAEAVAYHADRAGIALDDADLSESVADLPCTALEWAETARSRRPAHRVREALAPGATRLLPLISLAACGLLDTREAHETVEAGIALLRAIEEAAPNLQGWRHLAFVRDHAEAMSRPRILARMPVPETDADALAGLSPA